MDSNISTIIALGVIAISSITLFTSSGWRPGIIAYASQYIGVFILTSMYWPTSMAVIKLISGWIAGAIIGMAMTNVTSETDQALQTDYPLPSAPRQFFYLFVALIVALTVISLSTQSFILFPDLPPGYLWGGMMLASMGLLKVAFSIRPFHAILGLLTALAGFEVIYAAFESAALVAGLLALINLGIALAGAYILVAPLMEEPG